MMRLVTDITQTEQCVVSKLALQRQHVRLGVGNRVRGLVARRGADWFELGEVDVGVRIVLRYIERRELRGEALAFHVAGGGVDEWSGEERRRGARVGESVGRVVGD